LGASAPFLDYNMSLLVLSHFHKDFPINHNSSWLIPSVASDKLSFQAADVTEEIKDFRHYYVGVDDEQFYRAMGQQATEYKLLKSSTKLPDYVGCLTYRRYLLLNDQMPQDKIIMPATQESANQFGTEEEKVLIEELFKSYDVITNINVTFNCSIEQQYLMYELPEYWFLFKDGITKLYPEYESNMSWFTENNSMHAETNYIMKRECFIKYATEFFQILKYVYENCSEVYPVQDGRCSEVSPWRYPGFLGERFLPFFVHANKLKTKQFPLVILQ